MHSSFVTLRSLAILSPRAFGLPPHHLKDLDGTIPKYRFSEAFSVGSSSCRQHPNRENPSCRLRLWCAELENMQLLSKHWCVHRSMHRPHHTDCHRESVSSLNTRDVIICATALIQLIWQHQWHVLSSKHSFYTPGGAKSKTGWVWFVFIHAIQQNFWYQLCCKALECTRRRVPLLY